MADFRSRMNKYLENVDEAAQPVPDRKSTGSPSLSGWSPAVITCTTCEQTVYSMEKLMIHGKPFHKACFRCSHCSKILGIGNYASYEGKPFCEPHYKQLFALKGNFREVLNAESPKLKTVSSTSSVKSAAELPRVEPDPSSPAAEAGLASELEGLSLKPAAADSHPLDGEEDSKSLSGNTPPRRECTAASPALSPAKIPPPTDAEASCLDRSASPSVASASPDPDPLR